MAAGRQGDERDLRRLQPKQARGRHRPAHPDGASVAFELARRADVIIENFVPGVAAKLGLGYEAVRADNPTIVYASVSGFGQTGPYARRPGYNTIAMGMSGVMALTGWPKDPPTRPGGSIADLAASFLTFGAINAALVHRFRAGRASIWTSTFWRR